MLPAETVVGSNRASATRCGWVVARSLKPGRTTFPEHTGQPVPFTLVLAPVTHSCPFAQRHRKGLPLLTVTIVGSNTASAARSGLKVARSLKPGHTRWPAQ